MRAAPEPARALFASLSAAEDSLSRLEARLQASPLAAGWAARIAFHEAVAWLWNEGELASLEDLVLLDARLEQRAPDPLVTRAHAALRRRRRMARSPAPDVRTWAEVLALMGRRVGAAPPSDAASAAILAALTPRRDRKPDWWEEPEDKAPSPPLSFLPAMAVPISLPFDQDQDVFAFWMADRPELTGWPPLLCAAVRLDLWTQLSPLPRAGDIGPLVVEAQLKASGRLRTASLLPEIGRRALSQRHRRWSVHDDPILRAGFWLDVIAEGARRGQAELDTLEIARQRLDRLLQGRRSSSRLPDLAQLFLSSPLVTAPHAAKVLKVSQQAVRVMIDDLAGPVREVTGRRSFRAWRI